MPRADWLALVVGGLSFRRLNVGCGPDFQLNLCWNFRRAPGPHMTFKKPRQSTTWMAVPPAALTYCMRTGGREKDNLDLPTGSRHLIKVVAIIRVCIGLEKAPYLVSANKWRARAR